MWSEYIIGLQFRPSETIVSRGLHIPTRINILISKKKKILDRRTETSLPVLYKSTGGIGTYPYDVPYGLCKAASLKADKYNI